VPTPTHSPTPSALVGYSLARRSPTASICTGWCRQSSATSCPRTGGRPLRSGCGAARRCRPGDPQDPAGWPAYAALAPHVLAAGPLADFSPAGRHVLLETIRYLHARGDGHGSQARCQQLLDRWRAGLGPDHPDTLTAANTLTLTLFHGWQPA